MKKIISLIFAAVICLSFSFGALALERQSNNPHINDFAGSLTQEEKSEAESIASANSAKYQFDFVVFIFNDNGMTCDEYTKKTYEDNSFGYGDGFDGIAMGLNADTEDFYITSFGRGKEIFEKNYLYSVSNAILAGDTSIGGAVNSFLTYSAQIMDKYGNEINTSESGSEYGICSLKYDEPKGYVDGMEPNFADNSLLPRVIDNANIIDDEAEEEIKSKIAVIAAEAERDIVIYTTESSGDEDHDIYNVDFYDFYLYGRDNDHSGVCLMVCMDSDHRGWYVSATGNVKDAYTEDLANSLDDRLYEYMVDGEYTEGISDWVDNVGNWFIKGTPFVPQWYPADPDNFVRKPDPNAPKVVDLTGSLSKNQIESLTEKLSEFSEKHKKDAVILVTDEKSSFSQIEYAEKFYYYGGYGYGDNYEGILFTFFDNGNNCVIYQSPSEAGGIEADIYEYVSERSDGIYDLENKISKKFPNYFAAGKRAVKFTDKYLTKGRVPTGGETYLGGLGFSAVIALIVSLISTKSAENTMKVVKKATTAENYLVPGTYKIVKSNDRYINSTVTRVYNPPSSASGGGGSGGGSSHSSSFSGSSGSSHSGSGRSF